jgi:hypothetical protein
MISGFWSLLGSGFGFALSPLISPLGKEKTSAVWITFVSASATASIHSGMLALVA